MKRFLFASSLALPAWLLIFIFSVVPAGAEIHADTFHSPTLDRELPSGTYVLRLEKESGMESRKVTLVR